MFYNLLTIVYLCHCFFVGHGTALDLYMVVFADIMQLFRCMPRNMYLAEWYVFVRALTIMYIRHGNEIGTNCIYHVVSCLSWQS